MTQNNWKCFSPTRYQCHEVKPRFARLHTHTNTHTHPHTLHTHTHTHTHTHAQRVCVFVYVSVCVCVCVCVVNVRIVKSSTFVWFSCFQIFLFFLVDNPIKPRFCFFWQRQKTGQSAVFLFGSVTVNTVVHTESESCQKQCESESGLFTKLVSAYQTPILTNLWCPLKATLLPWQILAQHRLFQ